MGSDCTVNRKQVGTFQLTVAAPLAIRLRPRLAIGGRQMSHQLRWWSLLKIERRPRSWPNRGFEDAMHPYTNPCFCLSLDQCDLILVVSTVLRVTKLARNLLQRTSASHLFWVKSSTIGKQLLLWLTFYIIPNAIRSIYLARSVWPRRLWAEIPSSKDHQMIRARLYWYIIGCSVFTEVYTAPGNQVPLLSEEEGRERSSSGQANKAWSIVHAFSVPNIVAYCETGDLIHVSKIASERWGKAKPAMEPGKAPTTWCGTELPPVVRGYMYYPRPMAPKVRETNCM